MKIGPRQHCVIAALVSGRTKRQAAKAGMITTMTLHRWQEDEAFQAALDDAISRVFGEGLANLKAGVLEAVSTLRSCLRASRHADRIRAALGIINAGLRAKELLELEERVNQLEAENRKGKKP